MSKCCWIIFAVWDVSVAINLCINCSFLHLYLQFYCRMMLCISAAYAVMRCLSVCLSICLSRLWIMSKRINISSTFFQHRLATVFPYQTGWQYSNGNFPNRGVECRWGIRKNRDSGLIVDCWTCEVPKSIYRWRSWVYDIVGHAPLAIDRLLDVRTTKWQKQLPTTMKCRSHSRRLTSECLFVTACSMDEYAEEKRTEKN